MLSTKSIPRVFTRVTQTPQTFTQLRFKTAKATKIQKDSNEIVTQLPDNKNNVVKYLESSSFLRWLLIQNEQFADRLFEQFRTGDAVKMFYYDDNVVLKYSGTILGIEGYGFNQRMVLHDPTAQVTLRFPLNSPRVLRLQVIQRNFEEPTRKFYELM